MDGKSKRDADAVIPDSGNRIHDEAKPVCLLGHGLEVYNHFSFPSQRHVSHREFGKTATDEKEKQENRMESF